MTTHRILNTRADFAKGFRAWVRLCARDEKRSPEWLRGWDTAAAQNERGGNRPVAADAAEYNTEGQRRGS